VDIHEGKLLKKFEWHNKNRLMKQLDKTEYRCFSTNDKYNIYIYIDVHQYKHVLNRSVLICCVLSHKLLFTTNWSVTS
jgi:hypothetical protein